MRIISALRRSSAPMNRTLFGYMALLALIVLAAFIIGAFLMGRFDSAEKAYYNSLDMQMEVFEKDVTAGFEEIAFMGVRLSEEICSILDEYTQEQQISFDGAANSGETILDIQERTIETLKQQLFRTDCSGAFMLLDMTAGAGGRYTDTRSGLYLQKSGVTASAGSDDLLLYRGNPQAGKKHDVMPHRKWRLEFQEESILAYMDEVSYGKTEAHDTYDVTEAFLLPGTSEKAMLLIVPMVGADGSFYGMCGFEINESYFKRKHAQASRLPHLTCILTEEKGKQLDTRTGLSSGVKNGYYLAPEDELEYDGAPEELITFSGKTHQLVGLIRKVSLDPGASKHLLAVMIPGEDYEKTIRSNVMKTTGLLVLLFAVTLIGCLYLSRRFLHGVEAEKAEAQEAYQKAQTELQRLAYSRRSEIDPDDYRYFLAGLKSLTPTEKTIFGYYVEGNTVKEVMGLAGIKESTLRYHNQNIYRKLGVNSMKQMLRYAALYQQEQKKPQGQEE